MSAISDLLNSIKTAVYGKDVRNSIHDAIKQCYDDVTTAKTKVDTAVTNANNAATTADKAAANANAAASDAQAVTNLANEASAAATKAKNDCDTAVAALPTDVSNMFGALGLKMVDGALCVEVTRDE